MSPVPADPVAEGRRRRRAVGTLVLVLGSLLVAVAPIGFLVAFVLVASDPMTPSAGFERGADGTVRIVLDPVTAAQTTAVELYGADVLGPHPDDARPVWEATRSAATAPAWPADGLRVGDVPPGYTHSGATAPPGTVRAVLVTNGCYQTTAQIPTAAELRGLAPGQVQVDDTVVDRADFLTEGGDGYSRCPTASDERLPQLVGGGALALLVVGLVVASAGLTLRADGPRRRYRRLRHGWWVSGGGPGVG